RHDGTVCVVDGVITDAQLVSFANLPEHVRPDVVDDWNAGRKQHLRPQIRITTGDTWGDVDDRRDTTTDECFGSDAVEVDVVDDRDVAWPQPFREVLRTTVQARRPHDARRPFAGAAAAKRRNPHRACESARQS